MAMRVCKADSAVSVSGIPPNLCGGESSGSATNPMNAGLYELILDLSESRRHNNTYMFVILEVS